MDTTTVNSMDMSMPIMGGFEVRATMHSTGKENDHTKAALILASIRLNSLDDGKP